MGEKVVFCFFFVKKRNYSTFPVYAAVGDVSASSSCDPMSEGKDPKAMKSSKKKGLFWGIAQAGMQLCILWGSNWRDPPQSHPHMDAARGGSGDAPYLCVEAGGIEDSDLVGTTGPEGLVQRQEGSDGAGTHSQEGGLLRRVP